MSESAFPVPLVVNENDDIVQHNQPGLTKREWMAGMIACGYVANKSRPEQFLPEDDAAWILRLTDLILDKAKS